MGWVPWVVESRCMGPSSLSYLTTITLEWTIKPLTYQITSGPIYLMTNGHRQLDHVRHTKKKTRNHRQVKTGWNGGNSYSARLRWKVEGAIAMGIQSSCNTPVKDPEYKFLLASTFTNADHDRGIKLAGCKRNLPFVCLSFEITSIVGHCRLSNITWTPPSTKSQMAKRGLPKEYRTLKINQEYCSS